MSPVSTHSVFRILEDHASRRSDVPAIIDGPLRMSYADLVERVERYAEALLAQSFVPGAATGISITSEIDHLVCAMALLCSATPQANLASHEPPANKRTIAEKLGLKQIVAADFEPWMAGPKVLTAESGTTATSGSSISIDLRRLEMPRDATLIYRTTSGSTKAPRIFGTTLERLLLMAERQANTPSERRVLRTSSMEFEASRNHRISALMAGNTCVFCRHITLETLGDVCADAEVSEIHIGTYKLATLVRTGATARRMLPSYTKVMTGGSRVPGVLRRTTKEVLTANLWVHYATSETGPISIASPDQHTEFPEGVGFPLPGVVVDIVDDRGGSLIEGEIGQARIRKAGVPHGYVGDTASSLAFRDGWFYPGDLLSRSRGGPLVFHGRVDDVLILNGINIFPSAIEDLLEGHPDVREAVAFARTSRIHGQIPIAAVVLNENARQTGTAHLLHHCRQALGLRAPRQIISVAEIPRNSVGKPLRRILAEG